MNKLGGWLFGEMWRNSLGSDNYWVFGLQDDTVTFSYYELFDANLDEWTSWGTLFSVDGFRKCLKNLLTFGEAELRETQAHVHFQRQGDSISIRVAGPESSCTVHIPEVPERAKALLGIGGRP